MPQGQRGLRPLDPPMVPFVLAGTGIWVAAGAGMLLTDAPTLWLRTSLAGSLIGLALLVLMIFHDRRRRARRRDERAASPGD